MVIPTCMVDEEGNIAVSRTNEFPLFTYPKDNLPPLIINSDLIVIIIIKMLFEFS